MENKFYFNSFIEGLKILSYAIKNNDIDDNDIGIVKNIFIEVVRNSIMAVRDGIHYYIPHIRKFQLKGIPREVYRVKYDIFTISCIASYCGKDIVKENTVALTIIIRKLSFSTYSLIIWISQDLDIWQPLPLYNVFSLNRKEKLKTPLEYSYWAQKCFYKKQKSINQLPFQSLSKENIYYLNQTYVYPVIFDLFMGFMEKYHNVQIHEKSQYIRTLLSDEEGDSFSLNWIKYQEIL